MQESSLPFFQPRARRIEECPAAWGVRVLLGFALAICATKTNATTDKYRLSWRDDPATTMVVAWNQVDGTNPAVRYDTVDHGADVGAYAFTRAPDRAVNFREMNNRFARLSGLAPDTVYYFVIADSDSTSPRFWFRTAPAVPQPFTYIAGGDSRTNAVPRRNGNRMVARLRPLFVAFCGDYTEDDTDAEWLEWMEDWQLTTSADGRMYPILAAQGNHEFTAATVVNLFDVPSGEAYYALGIGGSLFRINVLNTETVIGGSQAAWLDADLAAHAGTTWLTAMYHRPIRPHTASKAEGVQQYVEWAPIIFDRGVDLVTEGDSHMVKRTYPIEPSTGPSSDEGYVRNDAAGTVFAGEGSWGAPLTPNDDDKTWTMASGSFNQLKWIRVTPANLSFRSVRIDNAESVGEVDDADPWYPPANTDLWRPPTGDTVTLPFVASANLSPQCDAGADMIAIPAEPVILDGRVTDDGATPGVSTAWSVVSGPGEVLIDDPAAIDTVADFGAFGEFVLRLTADDGEITAFDDVVVTVTAEGGTFVTESVVSASADDAEESAVGAVNLVSTDLEMVEEVTTQTVGIRFVANVPRGATILDAYIQFTADEKDNTATNLVLRGQAADDAPPFQTIAGDITARPLTAASVAWNPPGWHHKDGAGPAQRTPGLSPLIGEIVARPGWQSSNGLAVIISGSGKRVADSYDGSAAGAPLLHVEYEVTVPAWNLWNFAHFTPAERADPGVSGFSANPDGDILINLFEYAFDRDPKAAEGQLIMPILAESGGEDFPAIVYPRRKGGSGVSGVDYRFENVGYRVEVSTDLAGWSTGAGFVEEVGVTDDGNGVTETVTVRSETPLSAETRQWLRLVLTLD